MREKVKDKGRLEHILQTCNDLLASKDKYTFDAVKDNPIIFYGFVKLSEIIGKASYMLTKEFRATTHQGFATTFWLTQYACAIPQRTHWFVG